MTGLDTQFQIEREISVFYIRSQEDYEAITRRPAPPA
jgi:hypothetical protein